MQVGIKAIKGSDELIEYQVLATPFVIFGMSRETYAMGLALLDWMDHIVPPTNKLR